MSVIENFIAIVGAKNAITDPAEMAPFLKEWRGLWVGKSPLVLKPATTEEVSAILKLAHETNTKIVPQSGHTGLVGGGTPDESGTEIVLSLARMNKIIAVDASNFTMTVEAGAVLKSVQDAALEQNRLFPLSLASEGSCRIGGTLSTNAGGLNVLAYGNARELCLGLEVVLADGRVLSSLSGLRKDNTGYDLRNIFIGAEGTLGVITKAVLKLFPLPERYDTAFIAVPSPEAAVELFGRLKSSQLTSCELVPDIALQFVAKHFGATLPLATASPWYVLAEFSDAPPERMNEILEAAMGDGLVTDAVVAASESQRKSMWACRENISEAQRMEGASIKLDVAVPVSQLARLVKDGQAAALQVVPGARAVNFGHLGDGNLHMNFSQPVDMAKQDFVARTDDLQDAVYNVVTRLGGTISAEHGIGLIKRERLLRVKSAVEIEVMRELKSLFDHKNILNPGRVLKDSSN